MGRPRKPNHPRRHLGRTLRDLRERNRLTQEEVAQRIRCSKAKISRIELGQLPNYHEFLAMLDLYGVITSDYGPYVKMFDRAEEKGWWHHHGQDDQGFTSLEAEACMEREYQVGYFPGLLQTEAFMRANFGQALSSLDVDNEVAVRLRRKRRLTEEPVLQLHAIVDEAVLRRPVPGPAEQRAQLEYLIEMAALPTVTLQVIRFSAGAYHGRGAGFIILSYPDPQDPNIAYLEHGFGAVQTEKDAEIRSARLTFEHQAEVALDQEESIAFIRRVINEI